jgi:tRNA dimethylallyltransferase
LRKIRLDLFPYQLKTEDWPDGKAQLRSALCEVKNNFEAFVKNGGVGSQSSITIKSDEIQETLNFELETQGIGFLQAKLKALDFKAYEAIDIQNSRRVIRALEVMIGTGNSILFYQQKKRIPFYPFLRFYVQWERADLYAKINMRVDQMISEGLESEVTALRDSKYQTVLNTVGYKEWEMFFNGIETKEAVIEKIKQNSRNYAKRQLTWMNQYEDLTALNPYSEHSLLNQLLTFVNTSNRNR